MKRRTESYKDLMTKEDRLGKVKKKGKGPYILAMLGCLTVLVLVMYLGTALFVWLNEGIDSNTKKAAEALGVAEELYGEEGEQEVQTYTRAELEEQLARAALAAKEEGSAEVLNAIKASLEDGISTVETLRPFYPGELVLASSGRLHFVPIKENLKKNSYLEENLTILENGEYQYAVDGQVTSHKGIDVSKHQGSIDWNAVAEDGVEFAFIRVALRGYGTGKLVEDEYFEENIQGAVNAGIKVGVYIYSQAVNEEELLEEANLVLEKIAPYKIECPVVFDVEKVSGGEGRMNKLTLEERTNLTLLFCQTIENAGYRPMIYHNMEMGVLMLDLETLENYDKWFAYYNQDMYYPYDYKIWQYSDKGTVNGISTGVDLNISFEPLWE